MQIKQSKRLVLLTTMAMASALTYTPVITHASDLNKSKNNQTLIQNQAFSMSTLAESSSGYNIDASDTTIANGTYVKYTFPDVLNDMMTSTMKTSFKVNLEAKNKYFLQSNFAHTVTIYDSNNKQIFQTHAPKDSGHELTMSFFDVPNDGNYTIVYSDFDQLAEKIFNVYPGVSPELELYQGLDNDHSKIKLDFDKKKSQYGQTKYGYVADSGNADRFIVHMTGHAENDDPKLSYQPLISTFFKAAPTLDFTGEEYAMPGNLTDMTGQRATSYQNNVIDHSSIYHDYVTVNNKNYLNNGSLSGYVDSDVYIHKMPTLKEKVKHLNFWKSIKSLIGDPVDTFSGSFSDERTLMSYSGTNPLSFSINYNSLANDSDSISGGYTHNFETKLKIHDNSVSVMWTPNTQSDFIYDDLSHTYSAEDAKQSDVSVVKKDNLYIVTNPGEGTYTFNEKGQLLNKIDSGNQTINYTYNLDGTLSKVQNSKGQYYEFSYDADKHLISVYNDIQKINLSYQNNVLSDIFDLNNKDFHVSYNNQGRISDLTYNGTNLIHNDYDDSGRVISQKDQNNIISTFNYQSTKDNITTDYYQNKKHIIFVHDNNGNLLSVNKNGQQESYIYNDINQKTSYTDANGNTYKYNYDSSNNITSQIDPQGNETKYYYDNNLLTGITTADNISTKNFYNNNHQLIKTIDKAGKISNFSYDKFGNLLTLQQIKNNNVLSTVNYKYDDNGYLIAINNDGKTTNFINDNLGRSTETILPNGKKIDYTYDNNNNVLTSNVSGKITKYTYNDFSQLLTRTLPNGKKDTYSYQGNLVKSSSINTENSRQTEYDYDENANLSKTLVGNDTTSQYDYDLNDNVLSYTNANGNTTKYAYDNNNNITKSSHSGKETDNQYNRLNQLVSSTDPNGNTTKYSYDNLGNVSEVISANGDTTKNEYDSMGNITSQNVNGKITTYAYDDSENLSYTIDPNNNKTSYIYNSDGQLTQTINALNQSKYYFYNDLGQLVKIENNRKEQINAYAYDDYGNIVSASDSDHVISTYSYDSNNNLVEIDDAYGNPVSKKEYDQDEKLVSAINGTNKKTTNQYEFNSSKTTITSITNNTNKTVSNYDGENNLVNSKDDVTSGTNEYNSDDLISSQYLSDNKNKTSYSYDKNDNVSDLKIGTDNIHYDYNSINQLTAITNGRRDKTNYTYSDQGDVTEVQSSDIDNKYSYDNNGNELTAQNSNSSISKEYDVLNRVVSKTQDGKTIKYVYDDRGFLTDIAYPNNKLVHYDVNTDGQITAMTDWNNHKTAYDYDKNGRIIKTINWNGIVEERSYNNDGQVLTIKASLNDKILTNYKYTYDSEGNLVTDNSSQYTYDSINRLISGKNKYTYDAIGNITSVGSHKMTYDDNSQLINIDGNSTSYDSDGNLTSYSMLGNKHSANYNSQNQLTHYDNLSYNYDADGNRISAGNKNFVYDDNGHLLSDGTNTYLYGASGLVGYYDKNNKFVTYLFNQRGDVVKETNELGSLLNNYDYDDYGKLISADETPESVFGYGGQYGAVSDSNGLIFLRTRFYNPEIMRFMNRDTISGSITDTKSLNRFAYVEGNPLTYIDPNGQAATWIRQNPLDALYYGLTALSFIPGLNVVASLGMMAIDVAKGDYTALTMDSLGILLPGAAVGLKIGYDSLRTVVDGLRFSDHVANLGVRFSDQVVSVIDNYKSFQNSGNQLALATGFVDNSSSKIIARSASTSSGSFNKLVSENIDSSRLDHGIMYSDGGHDIAFNYQHSKAFPESPRPLGSHGGKLQSHHFLQKAVMKKIAPDNYNANLAPTITIETNAKTKIVDYDLPHTEINRRQMSINKKTGYNQSLDEELEYATQNMREAGFSDEYVQQALNDNYAMLDKLGLDYTKIKL